MNHQETFPQEPAFGSPEAIAQAATTIRHTPGPWEVAADPKPVVVTGDYCIATCHGGLEEAGAEDANALLIAAAPELADVLDSLVTEVRHATALPSDQRSEWTDNQHFRRMALLLGLADATLTKAGRPLTGPARGALRKAGRP